MTYDGSNLCAYQNGVQEGCTTFSGGNAASGGYPIGIGFNPSYGSDFFPGLISSIRISTYGWDSSTILNAYNAGQLSNSYLPDSLYLPLAGSMSDPYRPYSAVAYVAYRNVGLTSGYQVSWQDV